MPSPSFTSYDKSKAIQKYILNFWDEVKYVKENNMFADFLNVIATYLAKHHPEYSTNSQKLVSDLIVQPTFRRMQSKYEILWQSRFSLGFDFNSERDSLIRSNDSLKYIFGIKSNSRFRLPDYFSNLNSYSLASQSEWEKLISLFNFIDNYVL